MDKSKILEQIHKLTELANNEGAFEGEIAAASAAIQRLMDKYSISPEELITESNKEIDLCFTSARSDVMFGAILAWHWKLARIISRITHTKHFSTYQSTYNKDTHKFEGKKTLKGVTRESGKTISFFGTEQNIAVATALFSEWLIRLNIAAKEATAAYCKTLLQLNPGYTNAYHIPELHSDHPNVFRASWLEGCLREINLSLNEQEDQRDTNTGSALVVYEKKLSSEWNVFAKGMHTISSHNTRHNELGYNAGKEAGKTMHIGQKSIAHTPKQLQD